MHTVHLHRVLSAAPATVFKAFQDPRALAKWLPPYGYIAEVRSFDFRIGGTFAMSFLHLATGTTNAFGGRYIAIVPNERLVYTDVFDDPQLPGEMTVEVTLTPVSCGTDLKITQSGIPAVIPQEACYQGWQQSLIQLADLVAS